MNYMTVEGQKYCIARPVMSGFKFNLGEAVQFAKFWHKTPSGTFIVVGRHGEDVRDPGYRIRSIDDGSLRLGLESELAPASERAAEDSPMNGPRRRKRQDAGTAS
jgi:hypothetical protein